MKSYGSLLFLLLSIQARAQIFEAQVTDYGGLDSVPAIKNLIDQEVRKIQDDVNEKIPNGGPGRIMKGMSNASVVSGKGVGSDYSSHMEKYTLGVAVGGGVDLDRPTGTDSDVSGIGVSPGAVLGLNLYNLGVKEFANLDARRLNANFHYMEYGRAESLDPWIGMNSEARVTAKTMGFRMSYDWIQTQEHKNYSWGGIKLNWGFEHNESSFVFEHDLDITFQAVDSVENINGRVTGRPKYQVDVVTSSIPLEISTDITFFKFLTLMGGAGVDFNYGKAKGHAIADGDVSPLICTDSGGVCGGGTLLQMQVQATGDTSGYVDPLTSRVFAGLQINLPYTQLYTVVNKLIGNELLGATVGIRFVR